MSKINPEHSELLASELARIDSPVEHAAFSYFYDQTVKEGMQVLPEYTFDQFKDGIAPFNGLEWGEIDSFLDNTGLIPNYTRETTEANGLEDVVPLAEALSGPFIRMLIEKRRHSAVRVIGIHPSLATPYVVAGAINLAHMAETGEDIRRQLFPVVGAYPTVMKYIMRGKDGKQHEVSPVGIGCSLGNLVLTAPKTANTLTDEEAVQEWMWAARATFKVRNREIAAVAGNVIIEHPAGRRVHRSTAKVPPYHHVEYRPDSGLGYITDVHIPTFLVGVDDNLLNDPEDPSSVVNIFGDPRPYDLRTKKDVIDALKRSALLASHGDTSYRLEGFRDQQERLERLGASAGRFLLRVRDRIEGS